ncbi:MAG: tRNA (guanosine(37)-N1)-methyltransferase TrmD [Anaerosomatales bacterium]|nr:tRNA (guanosine(37)-N1)-methyltransferase TrmD [Anaerosomatales bacterium]
MRIDVITIFPEVFEPVFSSSMLGRAAEKGLVQFVTHDLRDYASDAHRTVDDYPFGGGPGMVMKPEPFFRAHEAVTADDDRPATTILLCPQGAPFRQDTAVVLARAERLILLCGRYEGFDERIRSLADLELSIGDYVLTGGELPAMVVVDAVARLVPGVLGDASSAEEESFSMGLLEYPQYTRPASYAGRDVPDVLLSGDHARIARWRREQAIIKTARRRPDLLRDLDLSDAERALAEAQTHVQTSEERT